MSEKILIIGGGFAGLRLARTLNQKREKRITVIDKVNHHMFQPYLSGCKWTYRTF
jgi:NADH dehydrogenase